MPTMNTPVPASCAKTEQVYRLALPDMGKKATGIRRAMLALRRMAEAVILADRGKVTAWDAKLLRTACKAFGAARRVDRLLARAGEPGTEGGMEHSTYQAYLDRSIRFEQQCDAALKALGIDAANKPKPAWPWGNDVIEEVVYPPGHPDAPPSAQDAAGASADASADPNATQDASDALRAANANHEDIDP